MEDTHVESKNTNVGIWLLAMLCVAIVTVALCGGTAYSGIRKAQFSAAKASLGQIEATLLLAERYAEDNGFGPPPTAYKNVLKSYDELSNIDLTPQEKYVLDTMLEMFGPLRDFDFAITRVTDGTGVLTQIYFYPILGKTNTRIDHYYLLSGGVVTEKNR